jgi:hypothetical protein
MLPKLLGYIKKQRKLRSWRSSVLGRAIDKHLRSYNGNWKNFTREDKQQLAADLTNRIFAVLESSNPILTCRKELVTNVLAFADLQVFCLVAEEKEKHSMYRDMKLVSGELHKYIYSCTDCDELNKYIEEYGSIQEFDLMNVANEKCDRKLYYASGFDIVRKNIEMVKDKDWFVPFVQSAMVVSESRYRNYLGLPSMATAIDTSFHSAFTDLVLSGEQDPLLSWERRYAKSHNASV